jgi:hypothetical protein
MHVRLALFAGSALCLVAAVHCARTTKPPEVVEASSALPDAAGDGGGDGGAGGAEPAPDQHRPDPALVQKALDKSGTPTSNDEAAHGLRFEVVEMGPNASWGLAVVNRGSETMSVVFDPRLLTLEVEAPPDPKLKKPPKPRVCQLPSELRPERANLAYVRELAPGRGVVEAFDPRLYCLPELGVSPLVPGARVSARFGWLPKTKTVWRGGKRVEEPLPKAAPFVAMAAPSHGGSDAGSEAPPDAAPSDAGDSAEVVMTETEVVDGVKVLYGTPFALGADYAPPPKPTTPGLVFELTQGSDAATEATATVTARLSNHGTAPERIFLRREHITFEVSSPDGTELCDPGPDKRSPDRQGFTLLSPGGSVTLTSRLAEMCPQDTFARPGLYLVHAAIDPDVDGAEFGFDAFVGHLDAERPAMVRIRSGRLPFPGTRSLEEVQVGATAPGPYDPRH